MNVFGRLVGDAGGEPVHEQPVTPQDEPEPADPRDQRIAALEAQVGELRADLTDLAQAVWVTQRQGDPAAARRVADESRRAAYERKNREDQARAMAELEAMRLAAAAARSAPPAPAEQHHAVRRVRNPWGAVEYEVDGRLVTEDEARNLGVA